MPLVDVEVVCKRGQPRTVPAQALADTLGRVFDSPPGRTWVRTRTLSNTAYAENGGRLKSAELPVFVMILHAHPPKGKALTAEVAAVTAAVARCLDRAIERVHVQYAPPGAGRQAFGGKLVR